jgi:hypothetical protein
MKEINYYICQGCNKCKTGSPLVVEIQHGVFENFCSEECAENKSLTINLRKYPVPIQPYNPTPVPVWPNPYDPWITWKIVC